MNLYRRIQQSILGCFQNPSPTLESTSRRQAVRRARRFCLSERGETAVLAALGMAVILGFTGLSVDVGKVRCSKRKLQLAADAAALAAALEVDSCNGQTNCTAMQTAAVTALNENGLTGSTLVTQCPTAATGTGLTLMVNNAPCLRGSGDPNTGNPNYVEVLVSEQQPMLFASAIGYKTMMLSARAEASRASNRNCVWALDPSGGNAITVDLLATVRSSCGMVDESPAWNAFSCNLLAYVSVSRISVNGGVEGFLCGANPIPTTGVRPPTPADPLASLPKPAVPACGTSQGSPYHGSSAPLVILGPAVLYPDYAYCGGITILPTANVTFMPGTYVLQSGGLLGLQGGLTVSLASQVIGQGVTFYNAGANGAVTFLAPSLTLGTVSLTAPTSGTYSGVLLMQDPKNSSLATLIASSSWNTTLEGAFYFPSAPVLYAVSGPAKYDILVAKDVEFAALTFAGTTLQSVFDCDYSSLSKGSPLSGSGSVLVQ